MEVKRDRDECQIEIDELILENECIRKALKQQQLDFDRLKDEHSDLLGEFSSLASDRKYNEPAEQIVQAEEVLDNTFQEDKANFLRAIDSYKKKCTLLEQKCKKYEEKLQLNSVELEKAKKEISNCEYYRQEDIERLISEKESLKADLKANKATIQSLRIANDELNNQIINIESKTGNIEKINKETGKLDAVALDSLLEQDQQEKYCPVKESQTDADEEHQMKERMKKVLQKYNEKKKKIIKLQIALKEKEEIIDNLKNRSIEHKSQNRDNKLKQISIEDDNENRESLNIVDQNVTLQLSELENKLKCKDQEIFKAKEQEKKLTLHNKELQNALQERNTTCMELEQKKEELNANCLELESAKKTLKSATVRMQEVENVSSKVTSELRSTKAELKKSQEKVESLVKLVEEKDLSIETLQAEFKDAKMKLKTFEKEACQETEGEQCHVKIELKHVSDKLKVITEKKDYLESENKRLKESMAQQNDFMLSLQNELENSKGILEELRELKIKEKRNRIEANDLMEKLAREESLKNNLSVEVKTLQNQLESRSNEEHATELKINALEKESEKLQMKCKELDSTLAETRQKKECLSERSLKIDELEERNEVLEEQLQKAVDSIQGKNERIEILNNQLSDCKEIYKALEGRNIEIKDKNKYIEEIKERHGQTLEEIGNLEETIDELQGKLNQIENEKQIISHEKKNVEYKLGQQEATANKLKEKEKELFQACSQIEKMTRENKDLETRCQNLERRMANMAMKADEYR